MKNVSPPTNELFDMTMDANYWRGRGQATRVLAEEMTDPVAKSMMLAIGTGYDVLAERIDERARQRSYIELPRPPSEWKLGRAPLYCVK
jgi:hypothetical protein